MSHEEPEHDDRVPCPACKGAGFVVPDDDLAPNRPGSTETSPIRPDVESYHPDAGTSPRAPQGSERPSLTLRLERLIFRIRDRLDDEDESTLTESAAEIVRLRARVDALKAENAALKAVIKELEDFA